MTNLPIPDLVRLRQHIKGLLSVLDMLLSQYDPICKPCFYKFGLVTECKCKESLTDGINKSS